MALMLISRSLLRVLALLVLLGCLFASFAVSAQSAWSFRSGGQLRFPNSQQAGDHGNAMIEPWARLDRRLWSQGKLDISVFVRLKPIADTADFSFNNATTIGAGLAVRLRPAKDLSLGLALRHDWMKRRDGTASKRGLRAIADFFYLSYQPLDGDQSVSARVIKAWGSATFPDSLNSGDTNLSFSGGAEAAWHMPQASPNLTLIPYVAMILALDTDGNTYNNKAQPQLGLRWRWRLNGQDVSLGLRYQTDYRWKNNSFRHGPGLTAGWYLNF